jgi:hypothetical protein
MSFNHDSCKHSPKTHRVRVVLTMSPLLLAGSGCSGAPTFNVLGSYFPSWLVCVGVSIVLTLLAHVLITRRNLADQLWPLPVVYPSLLCFFSCTLWLLFFE